MSRVTGRSAPSSARTRPKQAAPKKATSTSATPKKISPKAPTPTKKPAAKPTKRAPPRKAPPKASTTTPSGAPTATDALSARIETLTGVFTALGARDPERWARAHVEHGQDQIGRFVFLKALWGRVVRDGRFLDRLRRDVGESREVVERLLMCGAREADLVQLVRAMQVQLLVDMTQIIDDPSDNDEGVRWGLWRMDRRGLPLWQLTDLRLDVLEVDPADDL